MMSEGTTSASNTAPKSSSAEVSVARVHGESDMTCSSGMERSTPDGR